MGIELPTIALAAMLHATAPTHYAADTGFARCAPIASRPIAELRYVTLYGARSGSSDVEVLARRAVAPGERFAIESPDDSVTRTVWVRYTDAHGREGCESPRRVVNPPPNVGVEESARVERTEIFDIRGRRVREARAPGVYLVRELRAGKWSTRRVVVLR